MTKELVYTSETRSKIANINNRIMILQAKNEKSFNEINNHISNATHSELVKMLETLNILKCETEQMLSKNKELRDLVAVHQSEN